MMPSSSRRKQSRPQHLSNDQEDNVKKASSHTVASSGEPSSQDASPEVKVIGQEHQIHSSELNGIDVVPDPHNDVEDENSESYISEAEDDNAVELGTEEPHDLSSKVKVNYNDLDPLEPSVINNSVGQELQKTDKEMEHQPLATTTEASFQCSECKNCFTSKEVLEHHIVITHDTGTGDVSIAQQPYFNRKRPHDESLIHSEDSMSISSSSPAHLDMNSTHSDTNPTHQDTEAASMHRRMDTQSPLPYYRSAIPPHLAVLAESNYDIQMKAYEASLKSTSSNDLSDLHVCQVCSKMFPKPSDLKRHMMCHTGEKPFRCELCSKPFRAKSSMHYHLKATHGLDIELSPGLEERYLRMKTRAQMNLLQRGHISFPPHLAGSETGNYRRDHLDLDDLEDETKSTDSFYHNSGNGSDFNSETLSQGSIGQTGNDSKSALDLSMAGKNKVFAGNTLNTVNGEVITYKTDPLKKSKLSVKNETILVTRLDGLDLISGDNASVFKCYLCTSMFSSLSKLQCHLSIHFKKQVVTYQCCFCDKLFHYKMQMQNHLRCHHSSEISSLHYTKDSSFIKNGQSIKNGTFSCRFCLKMFDNKISLHKHARHHIWNRNCFCRICGKNFNQYTSLQIHISRFHWKTVGKAKDGSSWIRRNISRMKRQQMKPKNYDTHLTTAMDEPLNLIHKAKNQNATLPNQNVTVVMPQSPPLTNGNISDTAYSQHSSEHNWSETLSDNPAQEFDDGDVEIRSAPKRSLLPFKRDTSPRGRSSRKSTPVHSAYHNHATSDNDLPLNFSKSDGNPQDRNNNEASDPVPSRSSPELSLPLTAANPEAIMPGYALNATNQMLMAKALAAHQSLTHHLNNTSQPMIFPPNHLPPSLAAMTQMMSLPGVGTPLLPDSRAGTSKSPSPASHSSSKSDTSPEDRDSKEGIRDGLMAYPRVQWGQDKASPLWSFNMYSPPETGHTDGRKVTSLSRTHSRLGIVQSPINRESMCKATTLTDGRTVYKCPFCSKEFVSFSDINRHMDFHEDIRPYKCHYCDYYARTNSQLKVHMMRHQGIREFCCKLCNYKGVTQSDLNRHMKSQIHMLKSRNACTYCGEGFVTSKNLEKHLDGNCIVKMQKLNGGLDIPLQERVA